MFVLFYCLLIKQHSRSIQLRYYFLFTILDKLMLINLVFFADRPVASAFVCHSFGIFFLYLVQGAINLVGSPVGCRSHDDNTLEGLNMGSYLKRQTVTEEEPDCNKEPEDVNST